MTADFLCVELVFQNSRSTSEIPDPPTSDNSLSQNVINQILVIGAIVLVAIIVFIIACIILHNDRKKAEKRIKDKQSDEKQEE